MKDRTSPQTRVDELFYIGLLFAKVKLPNTLSLCIAVDYLMGLSLPVPDRVIER